jgi:hypothetical protein
MEKRRIFSRIPLHRGLRKSAQIKRARSNHALRFLRRPLAFFKGQVYLALSFETLLVLETLAITGIFALFYFQDELGERGNKRGVVRKGTVPAFLLFALGSAYLLTPQVDLSRWVFFLGESLVLSSATLFAFISDNPRTVKILIGLVVAVNILNGLASKLALGGVVWGEDERPNLVGALQIGASGNYNSLVGGFYQVPVISQLIYTLSAFTSLSPSVSLTVLSSLFIALFQGVVYLVTRYFTRDLRVIFAIQVIAIFVPRLDLVQTVIPEPYSLILGALSLFLILKVINHDTLSPIRDFLLAMVLYVGVIISHPSGAVLVLTFAILAVFIYSQRIAITRAGYRLDAELTSKSYSSPRLVLMVAAVLAFAYWVSIPQVEHVLTGQLNVLVSALSAATSGARPTGVSYTPLYTQSGLQYTLPWAIPVSVSAAYYLVRVARRGKGSWSTSDLMGFVCFLGGALLVVGSFVLLIGSPTSNADRYLGSPGYILLLFSLVAPLAFVSSKGRKAPLLALLVLLILVIAIGPSIPDIAPDAHGTIFEPPTISSIQFYGSSLPSYPSGAVIASEKNFQPPATLQAQQESGGTLPYSISYKPTRDLLGGISAGTSSILSHPNVYFVVDSTYLPGFLLNSGNVSDIYLSSGTYFITGVPS